MKQAVFILSAIVVLSCNTKSDQLIVGPLTGPVVDTLPAGCRFSEIGKTQVICISGADSNAFVSLNNKITPFRLVSSKNDPINDSLEHFIEEYRSGNYRIIIEAKEVEPNEAGGFYRGKMLISDKMGKRIEKQIEGNCGC